MFDEFLYKHEDGYNPENNSLIDLSFDFKHTLLTDNDYIIYFDTTCCEVHICYFENGYFYESILYCHLLEKELTLNEFEFIKMNSWTHSRYEDISDSKSSFKIKKITEYFIDHFKNINEFRYMFLFKKNVYEILSIAIDKNKKY